MNSKVETAGSGFDLVKWLVVFALVLGGAFAYSYFEAQPLLARVAGVLVVGLMAAFVAVNTAKGQAFWTLVKEAQLEVRKVVWPTNAETNQTTLLVALVVIITALILWVFDWGIGQLAKMVLGS